MFLLSWLKLDRGGKGWINISLREKTPDFLWQEMTSEERALKTHTDNVVLLKSR